VHRLSLILLLMPY